MFYTIYKTTNKVNGKFYIGKHQTENLMDQYMGSGKLLKRAIKKHGLENFTKEILFLLETEEEMNNKERELVKVDASSYNLCEGGQGGFGYLNTLISSKQKAEFGRIGGIVTRERYKGIKRTFHNEESRRKISQQKMGNKNFLGKKHKEETKRKIGEANKTLIGERNSQFGTCWITNELIDKKISKKALDIWLKLGYRKGRINRAE